MVCRHDGVFHHHSCSSLSLYCTVTRLDRVIGIQLGVIPRQICTIPRQICTIPRPICAVSLLTPLEIGVGHRHIAMGPHHIGMVPWYNSMITFPDVVVSCYYGFVRIPSVLKHCYVHVASLHLQCGEICGQSDIEGEHVNIAGENSVSA